MAQLKPLIEPTNGARPIIVDQLALENLIETIDEEIVANCFREDNEEDAFQWLKEFFTVNFGQNLPTWEERVRKDEAVWQEKNRQLREARLERERQAKETKTKVVV